MSRAAVIRGVVAALAVTLAVPGAAIADASLSTNWAGYAVHRTGVRFRAVSAVWTQPQTACSTPYPTYEASWVGIGGYNANSTALEQIGTELDCTGPGAARSGAWYEVVPAPSQRIRGMTIRPGDTVSASVVVVGRRVTLKLANRTRHESFAKTLTVAAVDVRSAEWIVEAPSACYSNNSCHTLPLTNFGTVDFSQATVATSRGRRGTISSPFWGRSRITLAPMGQTFITSAAGGRAVPSPLWSNGSSFMVTFGRPATTAAREVLRPRAAAARPVAAVEPGGHRR